MPGIEIGSAGVKRVGAPGFGPSSAGIVRVRWRGALAVCSAVLLALVAIRPAAAREDPASERCSAAIRTLIDALRAGEDMRTADPSEADRVCSNAVARRAELASDPASATRFSGLHGSLVHLVSFAESAEQLDIEERAALAASELGEALDLSFGQRATDLAKLARIRGKRGDPRAEEELMLRALTLAAQSAELESVQVFAWAGGMYAQRGDHARAETLYARILERLDAMESELDAGQVPVNARVLGRGPGAEASRTAVARRGIGFLRTAAQSWLEGARYCMRTREPDGSLPPSCRVDREVR